MKNYRHAAVGVVVMIAGLGLGARVAAEDVAQRVKDLYASAAYEAALTAISSVTDTSVRSDLDRYRVLCLVALGRTADAERVVEQVLTQDPLYRPPAADTPPRIQELFTAVRRRLGPSLARTMYLEGKSAFDRKDRVAAVRIFEQLARVTDDRDLCDDAVIGEIRLLAGGFLTLSKALPAPAVDRATPIAPIAPLIVPERHAASTTASAPVVIREQLPVWRPRDPVSRSTEFRGELRLSITTAGTVASAELVHPVHPEYDDLLRRAAKSWIYQPARINGEAVASERIIAVVLKPLE